MLYLLLFCKKNSKKITIPLFYFMSSVLGRCSGIIPRLNYGWLERKGPRWLDRIKQRLLYKSSKRLRPLKSNLSLRPFRPSPQVFTVDQVCLVKYFYFSLGSTLSSVERKKYNLKMCLTLNIPWGTTAPQQYQQIQEALPGRRWKVWSLTLICPLKKVYKVWDRTPSWPVELARSSTRSNFFSSFA